MRRFGPVEPLAGYLYHVFSITLNFRIASPAHAVVELREESL